MTPQKHLLDFFTLPATKKSKENNNIAHQEKVDNVILETELNLELLFEQLDLLFQSPNNELAIKEIYQKLKSLHTPKERVSHRFDGKNYTQGKGIDFLALGTFIEETTAFADEVERLCKEGLDRRSAYIKAKQNLTNMEK